MKALITGSSGFIGSYLTKTLQDEGYTTIGLDRCEPDWVAPDTFVHGDILDQGVVERALDGVNLVFHLAASKDDWGLRYHEYHRDNVEATKKLVAAGTAHGVKRWFHYSTVGVLGHSNHPLDETTPFDPSTDYGATKAEAEEIFQSLSKQDPGAEIIILRPSAVFGRRHPPTTNVYRLIEAIMGNRFVMVGDGGTRKTTSYIDNLLEATLFLLRRRVPGVHVFHYVDDPVITTGRLVELIHRCLEKKRKPWRLPLRVAKPVAYASDVVGATLSVNFPITSARIEKFCTPTNFSSAAIRGLGFRQPKAVEAAVHETVRWHLNGRGG